jgi:S1-C subfamily serine protease
MTKRSMVLLAMGAAAALPAHAQERPKVQVERTRPGKARVWVNGEEVSPLEMVASRRARLGVLLDMQAVQNDSIGATISSVTPGGPAAKAGIRAGDIVTRINGQRLVRTETKRDGEDEEQSTAALRLIETVAKLEPGDTVRLEYRRGKEANSVSVITAAEQTFARREFGDGNLNFELPESQGRLEALGQGMTAPRMMRMGGPELAFNFGGPFADLELAPINPDLGAYFGASEGVLVIDAPEKNTFGLKGGDVILSVDGRKARGPSSLFRILRSYEEGDVVKIEILRNKGHQTVTSKINKDE